MHNLANKYGGKCLSAKYINANTKLKWQCNKGHVWESTPSSVRQGHWCLECSGSKKKNIYDMQHLAKMRGGKCVSTEYINNKTKLKWQCNQGHIWEAAPSSVASRTWCPICGQKKSHESNKLTIAEMQLIAQNRNGKCLSKKYIDSKSKLKWQCEDGHVWNATVSNVMRGAWCPECAGNKKPDISSMNRIANERGGKCLSSQYINSRTKLKWQCKNGHTWEAIPDNVKRGSWCPVCVGRHQDIRDMHKLANEKGGKCLSLEYINTRTKLKWQCKQGHIIAKINFRKTFAPLFSCNCIKNIQVLFSI